jgi:hypothetical protein
MNENAETKVNKIEAVDILSEKLQKMSDEEFAFWCRENYDQDEKTEFLPYKTIVFKKNERGFYSNDLEKICLVDSHSEVQQVEPGQPYVVEVVKDTQPGKQLGALIVNIKAPATLVNIIKNREKFDLAQALVSRSQRDPKNWLCNDPERGRKITLVDRQTNVSLEDGATYIGHIKVREKIDIFYPALKAQKWSQKKLKYFHLTNSFYVNKVDYFGVKVINSSDYLKVDGMNQYEELTGLSTKEQKVLLEWCRRNKIEQEARAQKKELIEQALDRAENEVWQKYKNNEEIKVEYIDKKSDTFCYKVYYDSQWHDVYYGDSGKYATDVDGDDNWQRYAPAVAGDLIKDNRSFLELLSKAEKIDYSETKFKESVPASVDLTQKRKDISVQVDAHDQFHQFDCKTIAVDLPYVKGSLVFEPCLLSSAMAQGDDAGLYQDNDNPFGPCIFRVDYVLQAEKLEYTTLINNLPEHIASRFKKIINENIESLRVPRQTNLEYEAANWVAGFKEKIESVKSISLVKRLELSAPPNKNNFVGQLVSERLLLAERDFADLISDLPPKQFAQLDKNKKLKYFGLPVERKQAFKTIYYSRSSMRCEIPLPGEYEYVFPDFDNAQLSFWLDDHQKYFQQLKEKNKTANFISPLPILDVSIADAEEKFCQQENIKSNDFYYHDIYYSLSNGCLNLQAKINDDFSGLEVVVKNINNGFIDDFKNQESKNEVLNVLRKKQWLIKRNIVNLLKQIGASGEDLTSIKLAVEPIQIAKDEELPFLPI